jgi:hypothetical protein
MTEDAALHARIQQQGPIPLEATLRLRSGGGAGPGETLGQRQVDAAALHRGTVPSKPGQGAVFRTDLA